jgi:hypothetical protein
MRMLAIFGLSLLFVACGDNETPFGDDNGAGASSTTSSATSTTVGSGGGGDGGAAACVDLGEPCTACELAACPDVYCGCYGNASCGLLASCVLACAPEDTACLQECATTYPDGITDGALLSHCAAVDCAVECPGFVPLTDCQLCLYQGCEEEMNRCIANPSCSAALYCIADCEGDTTCAYACLDQYPSGRSDATAVGLCSQAHCTGTC